MFVLNHQLVTRLTVDGRRKTKKEATILPGARLVRQPDGD